MILIMISVDSIFLLFEEATIRKRSKTFYRRTTYLLVQPLYKRNCSPSGVSYFEAVALF